MTRLPFLAQRLFNTPLCIHPRKAEVIIGALAERLGIAHFTRLGGETVALQAGAFSDDEEFGRPSRNSDMGYDVVEGVAIIPIQGSLVQKLGSCRPYSGMTGYDGIRSAFLCAEQDDAVKAIVLDIDSPGGECSGMFDLCDELQAHDKPMWAIVDDMAASAAYAIACTADRIVVPRTGSVGSIGTLMVHTDMSKALEGAGLKVTFIQSSDRKSDGWPQKPLSKEAKSDMQDEIDTIANMFFDTVARNRKGLTADAVRDLEAGTFMGAAGVEIGLADAVMAPSQAFRALLASLG